MFPMVLAAIAIRDGVPNASDPMSNPVDYLVYEIGCEREEAEAAIQQAYDEGYGEQLDPKRGLRGKLTSRGRIMIRREFDAYLKALYETYNQSTQSAS